VTLIADHGLLLASCSTPAKPENRYDNIKISGASLLLL